MLDSVHLGFKAGHSTPWNRLDSFQTHALRPVVRTFYHLAIGPWHNGFGEKARVAAPYVPPSSLSMESHVILSCFCSVNEFVVQSLPAWRAVQIESTTSSSSHHCSISTQIHGTGLTTPPICQLHTAAPVPGSRITISFDHECLLQGCQSRHPAFPENLWQCRLTTKVSTASTCFYRQIYLGDIRLHSFVHVLCATSFRARDSRSQSQDTVILLISEGTNSLRASLLPHILVRKCSWPYFTRSFSSQYECIKCKLCISLAAFHLTGQLSPDFKIKGRGLLRTEEIFRSEIRRDRYQSGTSLTQKQ